MKILAFAATNSRNSINKQLVTYASSLVKDAEVDILDLNDYELPLFSIDREAEFGEPPALAQQFYSKIGAADVLFISYAEHNGTYSAAYKNLFDWTSRIDKKVFQGKPMIIMATSPGPGGAKNVLAQAKNSAPHFAGEVLADISVPRFKEAFDTETQTIKDPEIQTQLKLAVETLSK